VGAALDWLRCCGVVYEFPGCDRRLRACLVACKGHGIALVDGQDHEDEQRFSIAHELAHFLRDCWSVRENLRKRLGPAAVEVLDGARAPTTQERLHALLRDVPLGLQLHLLDRDGDGNPLTTAAEHAETDADRLAYELLAPAEHVMEGGAPGDRHAFAQRLRNVYGLPDVQATRYARLLLPVVKIDPLLVRLKMG
jgi:hypothetical protein